MAYWAVIFVFVYYYEVIARYVFNSPTNWVHESMFLMFGMQYILAGAYPRLLKKMIAPLLLIVLVLGVIFVGIATPVEAAGIGTSPPRQRHICAPLFPPIAFER